VADQPDIRQFEGTTLRAVPVFDHVSSGHRVRFSLLLGGLAGNPLGYLLAFSSEETQAYYSGEAPGTPPPRRNYGPGSTKNWRVS